MNCILKGANVYTNKKLTVQDVYISEGSLFLEYSPLFSDFVYFLFTLINSLSIFYFLSLVSTNL